MSWHFSQALVEEYLEVSSSDGEQFVQSKSKTIPVEFYYSGKTMESFRPSRYGTTSQLLTDDHGETLLTWFREGFRVKTSHALEKAKESQDPDLGYGGRWRELSVKYDHNTSSWKTHRCLFQEDLQQSSVNLPKWGMMLGGVCWELKMVPFFDKGFGLWPSPQASDGTIRAKLKKETILKALQKESQDHSCYILTLLEEKLEHFPQIYEWLMSWPITWTSLKHLETDKFQEWLQQHGGF